VLQQAGEREAGVSEPSVDRVGHGFDVHDEAGCGGAGVGFGDPLDERQLGGTIDRDDQVKLALLGTDLANAVVLFILCVAVYFATFLGYADYLISILVIFIVASLWFSGHRYKYVRRDDQFTMLWPRPRGY
jgi:hypothetical protein